MNETGLNKQFLLWFYYKKSNILKLELELDFSTSFYKLQMKVFLSAFIIQAIYISRSFEILVTDLLNLVYTYLFLYCKEFVIHYLVIIIRVYSQSFSYSKERKRVM